MILLILVGSFAALLVALYIASAFASSRFRARYAHERADLLRRGRAAPASVVEAEALTDLPKPVLRYLEITQTPGKIRPKVAILRQNGALRTDADKPWMQFTAEQVYSVEPPAFLWLADVRVAPLIHLLGRDRLVDGKGHMLISLLGLWNVADACGDSIDQGAALRYWGEIIALPETVVSPCLRWEAISESHARLLIEQDSLKLTGIIEFNQEGFPIAMHAERYRDVNGTAVLTPWTGYFHDWEVVSGRLFPTRWESVWHLAEGDFTAVRMEILDIRTE